MSGGCLAGMAFTSGKGPPPIYASTGIHGLTLGGNVWNGVHYNVSGNSGGHGSHVHHSGGGVPTRGSEDSVRERPG
jgi:hypothetical protein